MEKEHPSKKAVKKSRKEQSSDEEEEGKTEEEKQQELVSAGSDVNSIAVFCFSAAVTNRIVYLAM